MDNRFRREKNLPKHSLKNTKVALDDVEKSKGSVKEDIPFVQYFLNAYKQVRVNHIFRDTVLLFVVLSCIIFSLSIILPKVFLFHFDSTHLFSFLGKDSQHNLSGESESGDLDILVLGRWWRGNSAPDLTDSIILAHYNAEKKSLATLSIPRDLFVHSDTLGQVKINELYSSTKKTLWEEAAMNHLMEMVSQITGRDIRMYALIDFAWFQKLIDSIGGIDIDVPERLYDAEYPTSNWGYTIVNIPEWLQHFDWDKALKYSRSRHTTSDFDRSRRQQLVIQALRDKMISLDILTSPSSLQWIYTVLSDSVQTNISLKDIFKIAKIGSKIDQKNIHSYALDTSCTNSIKLCEPGWLIYSPARELYAWMSVLLPRKVSTVSRDTYENIRLFVAIISQYSWALLDPGFSIVNASGKTNLALTIWLKLKSLGIPVDDKQIKNQSDKIEKTFVRYNPTQIQPWSDFFNALMLIYSGEIREANWQELLTMTTPYELVLGRDAGIYFQ